MWFCLYSFYSPFITNSSLEETQEDLQDKKGSRWVNATKRWMNNNWSTTSDRCLLCTCLCFLCCFLCLLISTLGVACVDELCSVFGHQFDHSWNSKPCLLLSHTHTQPFHMCSHSPLSYTANYLSRRVISTVIQSGFGPRVIGYQSLAVKSIKITPTGDLQVLATMLMWTIHLINQYNHQKVLQFNTLLFYSSLKAWDNTHFIRTKPHSQWAVYPLR